MEFCLLIGPKMTPLDFENGNMTISNQNIIRRHVMEIKSLDKNLNDVEVKYGELREKHTRESNALYFYRNLHTKNKNENTLHGYHKLSRIKITCLEKVLEGDVFVLTADKIFKNLSNEVNIDKTIEINNFYDYLAEIPLPFIFLPNCDIFEYRSFSQCLNLLAKKEMKLYVSENSNNKILFLEPFYLCNIDLEYLVEDFINDQNIVCFLCGFFINKSF